jgi:hypothetical protein
LKNKLLKLNILLQSDLKNAAILCFTEKWLQDQQSGLTNTDKFALESTFSKISNERGGSYTYVKECV